MFYSATASSLSSDAEGDCADAWVFAYGSLMWNWPWPYRQRRLARLEGHQRSPSLGSIVYRGTPQKPGVGLGLVPGGHCLGIAFQVDAADWPAVAKEIDGRELVNGVYERVDLPVQLLDPADVSVSAVAYLARRCHPQFLHEPAEEELIQRMAFSRGTAGACLAYWAETLSVMTALGIEEPSLARLVALSEARWRDSLGLAQAPPVPSP